MVEGRSNSFFPPFFLSHYFFDLSECFIGSGHEERPEVEGLKDDDVVVVFLPLVVIVSSREEVCFLVEGTGLVLKREVVFREFGYPVCLSSI